MKLSSNNNFTQTIKIAIIWMTIATCLYFIIVYIEKKQIQNRITIQNDSVEITRSRDGHYYWTGSVNGYPVTFLIDTGASITSIPQEAVQKAGLTLGPSIELQTANGSRSSHIVKGELCLEGGICIKDLPMTIIASEDGEGLLGMNVINKMDWSQSNGKMRFDVLQSIENH